MGIDISAYMLELARDPVKSKQLDIEDIELRCGDIYSLELPDKSFDLIYSLGVVGEYSPINNVLLDRFSRLLAPVGAGCFLPRSMSTLAFRCQRINRLVLRGEHCVSFSLYYHPL